MMASIKYRQLVRSKREIRLVELLPRIESGVSEGRLLPRCKMLHVSLLDAPHYSALSYAWGDPRVTQEIVVDETPIPVTRNLYSAMDNLRHDTDIQTIWIDALCINQSNDEEKSWQIQLMQEIYGQADYVRVWLGPADATSDSTMDFLKAFGAKTMAYGLDSIVDFFFKHWSTLASKPSSYRDRGLNSTGKRIIVNMKSSTGVEKSVYLAAISELYYSISPRHDNTQQFPISGMNNLFTRAWWCRAWVLQEVTAAKKVGFACGSKRLSRHQCIAAINTFSILRVIMTLSPPPELSAYEQAIFSAPFLPRSRLMLGMQLSFRYNSYPLVYILRTTCGSEPPLMAERLHHLEATDPRDKIYALLGLATDKDELRELGLVPNYAHSCQQVYANFAIASFKQGQLSILSLCQYPKAQRDLPSWVPDWSQPLARPLQRLDQNDGLCLHPEYRASKGIPLQFLTSCNGGIAGEVSLLGLFYDEIDCIGNTLQGNMLADAIEWLISILHLGSSHSEQYDNHDDCLHAVVRTSTGDVIVEDETWQRAGIKFVVAAKKVLTTSIGKV
jgi:hypothetical protein